MEDKTIIQLFWDRKENAIEALALKYGEYLKKIATNILEVEADADECVNDTYLKIWNLIPPNRPENLAAYSGKIVRNLSFDKYKYLKAEKRGGGEMVLVLDELSECVSGKNNVEQEINKTEIARAINEYLNALPKEKCNVFVLRYWYAESVSDIAKKIGKTSGSISVILNRLRKGLKEYLTERGFEI